MRSGFFLDEESLFVAVSDDLHVTSFNLFLAHIDSPMGNSQRFSCCGMAWSPITPHLAAMSHARLNSVCSPAAAWDSARAFYEYAWLV